MAERKGPIKIALVGTSCIGKTETINEFRKRFENNPDGAVVDEAARDFYKANPQIPQSERLTAHNQGRIQALALQREKEAHQSGAKVIITDRSVLDAVAYTRAGGDVEGGVRLLQGVEEWVSTYTKIFLLDPADVPYEQDEIRTETAEERQGYHEEFPRCFMEAGISYELLSGTTAERVAQIDAVINEALQVN